MDHLNCTSGGGCVNNSRFNASKVNNWLTLALVLLGQVMIFISPVRDVLGPLWTGYPVIAFA